VAKKKSLTPAEIFDHRLAALLGMTVEEMRRSLTARAYRDWQLFWEAEPWGPVRDNLHAAIIASEIRRPQMAKGKTGSLDDFMLQSADERRAKRKSGMLSFLRGIAVAKPHGRSGKTSRQAGSADGAVYGVAGQGEEKARLVQKE
jgi:hypothetical protein